MCAPLRLDAEEARQLFGRPPFWSGDMLNRIVHDGRNCNADHRAVRWGDPFTLVFLASSIEDSFMMTMRTFAGGDDVAMLQLGPPAYAFRLACEAVMQPSDETPVFQEDPLLRSDCEVNAGLATEPGTSGKHVMVEPHLRVGVEVNSGLDSTHEDASSKSWPLLEGKGEDNLGLALPQKDMGTIQTLRDALNVLMDVEWIGLNVDFNYVTSHLHPSALEALKSTALGSVDQCDATRFHIYTDGSAKKGECSWAFVVLVEIWCGQHVEYVRIGYL